MDSGCQLRLFFLSAGISNIKEICFTALLILNIFISMIIFKEVLFSICDDDLNDNI